ncbi:nopp 140 functions as a transcriptional activator [Blastomyces dermatitidis ATCC 18188]|uniref:Nopp 140 functions as a transcriptional activator n=1 Tax=Ajellomyces dermatitidis (strain ATCC 18188 / CBS 674.68) TaxID=653446 RepID=F2T598_AJEDA|nr:nopp 140 functions as a transcriptional activator [Blastomyces dermatitidis ATCC 18188]
MSPAGTRRPASPGDKRKRNEDDEIDHDQHTSEEDSGSSGSESDDDYGPSLPPTDTALTVVADKEENQRNLNEEKPGAAQRDDWMLHPPEHGDWSSRVDPTKIRNRKFNMGRSAVPKTSSGIGTWTETAEDKRKRLEAEVLGVQAPANSTAAPTVQGSEHDVAMAKRVREYNEKKRSKTLYAQHQSQPSKEEEDDPSARPFDKEKDIRGPTKINHAQRRELLNRSSDFNTRFSGGKFL